MSQIDNATTMCELFSTTMGEGYRTAPRGEEIREILNPVITLDPHYPFQLWPARRYNIEYFKAEMRWKLGASRMDDSIKKHAKMWENVQNPDGSFNSNYGQFWFGDQMGLMKAVFELIRDRDSRRACIPMLTNAHLTPETRDTVCTESVTLHIRDNLLHMSVHMRSSDQIFGLGTDVPTFSVLLLLAHGLLHDKYPEVGVGNLTIVAASSHIYSRHFKMVEEILNREWTDTDTVRLPVCQVAQAMAIIADRGVSKTTRSFGHLYEFIYRE